MENTRGKRYFDILLSGGDESMMCQCKESEKHKVGEAIITNYETKRNVRIVEFKCKECKLYGIEKFTEELK